MTSAFRYNVARTWAISQASLCELLGGKNLCVWEWQVQRLLWRKLKDETDFDWPPNHPVLVYPGTKKKGLGTLFDTLMEDRTIANLWRTIRELRQWAPCVFFWGQPGAYDYAALFVTDEHKLPSEEWMVIRCCKNIEEVGPYGCVTSDCELVTKRVWKKMGLDWNLPYVTVRRGVFEGREDAAQSGFRHVVSHDDVPEAPWDTFICSDIKSFSRVAGRNFANSDIILWPNQVSWTMITRVLMTWDSGFGLMFPSASMLLEQPYEWCCLFGAGSSDYAQVCVLGPSAMEALWPDLRVDLVF